MPYDPKNPRGHYDLGVKVPESVIAQIRELGMAKSVQKAQEPGASKEFVEGVRRFYPFMTKDFSSDLPTQDSSIDEMISHVGDVEGPTEGPKPPPPDPEGSIQGLPKAMGVEEFPLASPEIVPPEPVVNPRSVLPEKSIGMPKGNEPLSSNSLRPAGPMVDMPQSGVPRPRLNDSVPGMTDAIDRRVGTPGTPGTPEVSLPNETPNPYGGDYRYDPPAPLEAGIGPQNLGPVPGTGGMGGMEGMGGMGGSGDPEMDELAAFLNEIESPDYQPPEVTGEGLEGAVARRTGATPEESNENLMPLAQTMAGIYDQPFNAAASTAEGITKGIASQFGLDLSGKPPLGRDPIQNLLRSPNRLKWNPLEEIRKLRGG